MRLLTPLKGPFMFWFCPSYRRLWSFGDTGNWKMAKTREKQKYKRIHSKLSIKASQTQGPHFNLKFVEVGCTWLLTLLHSCRLKFKISPILCQIDDVSGNKKRKRNRTSPCVHVRMNAAVHLRGNWVNITVLGFLYNSLWFVWYDQNTIFLFCGWTSSYRVPHNLRHAEYKDMKQSQAGV